MKIYFANNKYLTIDSFNEDYRHGFRYLNFSLNNSNLSFDSIFNFLSNPETLSHIIITNNKNESIITFNDVYHSVYSLNRNVTEDGMVTYINVQLSSSKDGMESVEKESTAI